MTEHRDILIDHEGSLVGFHLLSIAAQEWFNENVASEPWQWMGNILWVDHRYAADLFRVLEEEGFAIE
jgi:hypothetical protein